LETSSLFFPFAEVISTLLLPLRGDSQQNTNTKNGGEKVATVEVQMDSKCSQQADEIQKSYTIDCQNACSANSSLAQ
jgi:hypothetical protein